MIIRPVATVLLLIALVAPARAHAQERLPPLSAEKMTDAQKKAAADYKALRGTDLTGPPWSVLLRVPAQVVPALQIRLHYLNERHVSRDGHERRTRRRAAEHETSAGAFSTIEVR